MKNKKGQFLSYLPYILIGIILIIIFAVVAPPVAHIFDEVADEMKSTDQIAGQSETVKRITQVQALVTPALDQLIFILLFAIMIGSLVIAIFTDFHPVVLAVFILATIFLIIIAGFMANVYDELSENKILENKTAEFKLTNVVMGSQFPIIILVIGVVAVIIILSKRGGVATPV